MFGCDGRDDCYFYVFRWVVCFFYVYLFGVYEFGGIWCGWFNVGVVEFWYC